jgi:hypothetical protein
MRTIGEAGRRRSCLYDVKKWSATLVVALEANAKVLRFAKRQAKEFRATM